jgi:protein required for attachment to host cells
VVIEDQGHCQKERMDQSHREEDHSIDRTSTEEADIQIVKENDAAYDLLILARPQASLSLRRVWERKRLRVSFQPQAALLIY